MTHINIDGHEIELLFNVKAMNEIADLCGGEISNLGEKLKDLSEIGALNLFCEIICSLANGAVSKRNCDIALGLSTEKKKPEYTPEYFAANIQASDSEKLVKVVFETMNGGSEFTVPENVKLEDKDPDLAELEEERAKREGKF